MISIVKNIMHGFALCCNVKNTLLLCDVLRRVSNDQLLVCLKVKSSKDFEQDPIVDEMWIKFFLNNDICTTGHKLHTATSIYDFKHNIADFLNIL